MTVLALDTLPQAVLIAEASGQVLVRNKAATQMLNSHDDVASILGGAAPWGLIDWPEELAALREAETGISKRNLPITGLKGRQLVVDVYLGRLNLADVKHQPVSWAGRNVSDLAIVMVEDVAWRVSMERRLAASERMAAAGAVAAKVAHELNNPLDGILRYLGLAERTAGPNETEYLAKAREGLMRMAGIIREFIDAGGQQNSSGERTAVAKLLTEAISVMQPRADTLGVAVVCDLARSDDILVGGNIFQVFCNVIKNALDAMAAGGMLSIRLSRCEAGCRIDFEDDGCGIGDRQSELMFEPFYTTKPTGQGAGLGLAICREILSAAGGQIEAAPGQSGGTRVTVYLSAVERVSSRE